MGAALALALSAAIGCGGELPPPPDPVSGSAADTEAADTGAATGTSAGGTDSEPSDTARGDTAPPSACAESELGLAVAFEHIENPTLATVSARSPSGAPSAASVSYSEGVFSYQLALEPSQVLDDGALTWTHPFPSGARISLTLELTEQGAALCQSVELDVPEVDPGELPALTSTWSYEAWPRPVVMSIPITLQRPEQEPEERIVVIDHLGRYLWQHPYSAERALPTPGGVLVLPRDSAGELELELIRWDGQVEGLDRMTADYHHDFAYDDREGVLYTLSGETVEERQEACGLERVMGDSIVQSTEDGPLELWQTSDDYLEEHPSCPEIIDRSISYLNGLSFHDGLLAVSSSPAAPPQGMIVGWPGGEDWDFLMLLNDDEHSDIPVTYEGLCAEVDPGADPGDVPTFANNPHSSVCEPTRWEAGQGELNCFLQNRRRTRECDSLEWVRVTVEGGERAASCVATTYAHGAPMGSGERCGDWAFRGNVELLDGRTSDAEGAYGVQFSPGNTFVTGVRLLGGAEPRIERAFWLYDPNSDTSFWGLEEVGCLDPARPCTTSGTFATPRLGLGDGWSVSP